jgi:phage-related protein
MDLELVTEGASFTIYGMTTGEGVSWFLDELQRNDADEYARLDRRISQLAERGASRRKTEFNDLGDGLYELKTRGGARIIFFYDAGRLVICTQGFAKKSQKTPKRELEKALERKKAYERFRRAGGRFRLLLRSEQDIPERQP